MGETGRRGGVERDGCGGWGGRIEKENSDLYYTRIKIFSSWLFLPLSALANLSFTLTMQRDRKGREVGREKGEGERDLK